MFEQQFEGAVPVVEGDFRTGTCHGHRYGRGFEVGVPLQPLFVGHARLVEDLMSEVLAKGAVDGDADILAGIREG